MSNKLEIKISVRNLVEFILRSGSIDISFRTSQRAVEGTKAHQKVQSKQDDNYKAEVHLKYIEDYKDFTFIIEGRADGIISDNENIIIDEIKSTTRDLSTIDENYNHLHWAQAKCYGYIYSKQNKLENIDIQLTYFHLETETTKIIKKAFSFKELEDFFFDIIEKYVVWAEYSKDWSIKRDNSIEDLSFPFEGYRRGQRELAVAVYKTIGEQKKLFVKAPTGIGKTISTLFPTVKAFKEGLTSKIFYLTAKTITRQVAEEAFLKMQGKGLKFKTVTLTAKDKICFKEETKCEPEYCEYANGHFDRVNNAILDLLRNEDIILRENIEYYSKKHKICPFEFALDLSIWADCVICDYNYVFDPRVYLKRFFMDNNGDYTFLIDEAHNLVDRARGMYSAELLKQEFLDVKRIFKSKQPRIAKILTRLNSFMLDKKKLCEDKDYIVEEEAPSGMNLNLSRFISETEEWLADNVGKEGHKELLDLFFKVYGFLRILELYDERYVTYTEKISKDVKLKMFCLDPSYLLSEAVKRGKSAIFFSATLNPLEYYKEILGGNEEDYLMSLPSPFEKDNLCLIVDNKISTKYKDRENTYNSVVDNINSIISKRKGNYIAFFPSYKYMNEVFERFTESYPDINTIIQSNFMNEEQREEYLNQFKEDTMVLGFAVMGGIFSEGVDFKGDRLSGAIIVGVGLPQICLERNIIKDYFNEKNNSGFEYSYIYPGMNKVQQAAGRVIRTENDKGVVLLIDQRFTYSSYLNIFPNEWNHYIRVNNTNNITNILNNFWDED